MKILFYEEHGKHDYSIEQNIETAASFHTKNPICVANSLEKAISELKKEDFDLVIVHHHNFDDTLYLKDKSPATPFAGYHGCLRSHHLDREPGNAADDFIQKFNAHYEHIIGSLIHSLPKLLSQIKEQKYLSGDRK